ncbi:MAG: exopolysaccharide biosynthesis protein [Celeribacter sp.]|jgi:hypothetical protein
MPARGEPEVSELTSIAAVLDRVDDAADVDVLSFRDVVSAVGEASFVPVLMAPALAVVTPLSGIPLFSSFCGMIIVLVSAQMVLNRDHLWLPGWIMRRRFPGHRVKQATARIRGITDYIDRHARNRLEFLQHRPFPQITEVVCMFCGLAMPFLELVPFTSSLLGLAVTLLSLALLVRDGLLVLFGLTAVAGAVALVSYLFMLA